VLVDHERYAHAPPGPLLRYVAEHSDRVRPVWSRETDRGTVSIYEVK
jgi:hypothetical protein